MLPAWHWQVTSAILIHIIEACNGDYVTFIQPHGVVVVLLVDTGMKCDKVTLLVAT